MGIVGPCGWAATGGVDEVEAGPVARCSCLENIMATQQGRKASFLYSCAGASSTDMPESQEANYGSRHLRWVLSCTARVVRTPDLEHGLRFFRILQRTFNLPQDILTICYMLRGQELLIRTLQAA